MGKYWDLMSLFKFFHGIKLVLLGFHLEYRKDNTIGYETS